MQGNREAAGQAGAWAHKGWRGWLARPGRALLACSSAGGTGAGPDRAEEEYLMALDTASIGGQSLLQAVAREQAGGMGAV